MTTYAADDTSTAALVHRASMPLAERVEAVRDAVPTVTTSQATRLAHVMRKTRHSGDEGGSTNVTGLEIK